MNKDILLDKFLHSELSEDELTQFKNYLDSDEEFAHDVEIHSLMYAHRSRQIKDFLSEDIQQPSKPQTATLFKIIRNVAAIFVLGCVSYFAFNSINQEKEDYSDFAFLDEMYTERYTSPGLIQSGGNDISTWEKAIAFYGNKEYKKAESEILKIESLNKEQQFYLAVSIFYKDPPEYERSISILESIINNTENLHNDATQWNLALAYLKTNKKNHARPILNKIAASSNHYRKQEAIKVLSVFDQL
jgi:hypothetical protein